MLGGRLLRGATGGAGEIGYMPLPGAPLARGGDRSDARADDAGGGFQQPGIRSPSVTEPGAASTGRRSDAFAEGGARPCCRECARRLATGLAAVVAVVDPELVVLSGEVAQAGGEALRALVEEELTGLALPRPLLRISDIDGDPILIGALRTPSRQARDAIFDTT